MCMNKLKKYSIIIMHITALRLVINNGQLIESRPETPFTGS